jgi:TldD protein
MFEVFETALSRCDNQGASYIELRGESGFQEYIQMDDEKISALTQRIEKGVAVRTLVDGAWGFVSTSNLKKLREVIEEASKMAKVTAKNRRDPVKIANTRIYEDRVESKVEQDPRNIPISDKIGYLKRIHKIIKDFDERIKAVTIKLRTASGKKYLLTSEGAKIESPVNLIWVYAWVTGKDANRLSAGRHEESSTHEGWEFTQQQATAKKIGELVAKRVVMQLEGVPAKAGTFPCVLGPRVIGVLAHEALGHLAEADLTVNSSFNGKIGKTVAAPGVSMTDDGTLDGVLGSSKYDDEGIKTSKVEIIKDSVLKEIMTNREYASKLDARLTGNARAESFLHPPIIRMRNTFFEEGDLSLDEMFEGIKFGYYCADFRGGQAQSNASFQVGIQEAYEITNGKLGTPVTDLSISGVATDALFKITGIGRIEKRIWETGRCGKGQEAFVASGGPDIIFEKEGIIFGGKT